MHLMLWREYNDQQRCFSEDYIEKARVIFPFIDAGEQERESKGSIEKRHFRFKYDSQVNRNERITQTDLLTLKGFRKIDLTGFGYLVKADRLLLKYREETEL